MNFIVGLLLSLLVACVIAQKAQPTTLKFENKSLDWLSIHWIDPRNGQPSLIKSGIAPNSKFNLNSYVGHHLEIWQELDPNTGLCGDGDGECDKTVHLVVMKEPEECESKFLPLVVMRFHVHWHSRKNPSKTCFIFQMLCLI